MPPKSKVKLSPEEEEERKRMRRAKAAMRKEAKRLAGEEHRKLLKTEELGREIALGTLNTKRAQKNWLEMAMRAKMPFIKEDVEVAWHTFDRALDIKNYSISLLLDEVDSTEEQYQVNVRSHIEIIDRLLRIYKTRLQDEETSYQRDLKEMINMALVETEKIVVQETSGEGFLQAMMYAMEERIDEFMNNVKSRTITKVDGVEVENKNLRHVAKILLEKNLAKLWEELCHIISDYLTDTEARRKKYALVKAKDDKARIIISRQLGRTAVLFEAFRKLKEKIAAFQNWAEKQISEIMMEQKFFHKSYWSAKNRFLSEQSTDKSQLTIMTTQYNATMQNLQRLVTKGEHLLVLVQACRKYETQDEKVLPFAILAEPDEQTDKLLIKPDWERSRMVLEEFRNMEHFWRRTGAAQVMTTELRLERDKLKEEARCLRQCLEHCISQNGSQLLTPRPALKRSQ